MLQEARRIDPGVDRSWQAAVATAHVLFYRDGDLTTAHRLLTEALDTLPDPLRADDELLLGALHTLLMICWTGGRNSTCGHRSTGPWPGCAPSRPPS